MKKILIIEDEIDILESLAAILQANGFEVLTASSGEMGIAIAYSQQPDLILCDIMMPGMDGYAICRKLMQNELTSTTPFVFTTALAAYDDIRKGMGTGADDYITKPFKPATLIAAIRARLIKADQHQVMVELLIKETKKEVRARYLREIPDSIGNKLTSIIGSQQLLFEHFHPGKDIDELTKQSEDGTLSEPDQYIVDTLKACGQLYSIVWAMLRSIDKLRL